MGRIRVKDGEPTIVKKYTNRRLYDTGRSAYVTLDDLGTMIKEGHHFIVQDVKSDTDITQQVLLQIIQEKEGNSTQLLSIPFLQQLIYFYDDEFSAYLEGYLEQRLTVFTKHTGKLRSKLNPGHVNVFDQAINSWPKKETRKDD